MLKRLFHIYMSSVSRQTEAVTEVDIFFVAPCNSNSSSCKLHCLGDISESGEVHYRWKFDDKWTPPKPNEARRIYNDKEWTGPDAREATIHSDEAGRRVRLISCEIKNLFSSERSSIFNMLYKGMYMRSIETIQI